MATLEDLEARVAALEASQADYRAVLAAVNALGANQRDHALGLAAVKTDLAAVKTGLATVQTELADFRQETRATFRSVDENLAEIKDLIVGRRKGQ
jgi:ABC-type transporter Mla subunit MlaD